MSGAGCFTNLVFFVITFSISLSSHSIKYLTISWIFFIKSADPGRACEIEKRLAKIRLCLKLGLGRDGEGEGQGSDGESGVRGVNRCKWRAVVTACMSSKNSSEACVL